MKKPILQHKGFTLLELIIVCAIIGVLVAVIMPVYSGGVMMARRTACASNLRQIGTGLTLFITDNDGALPATTHSTGNMRIKNPDGTYRSTVEESWIYVLASYLGEVDEIRVCPADEPERRERIIQQKATSYILNDAVFDAERIRNIEDVPNPSNTMAAFISNRPVSKTWDHAHCANWTFWEPLTSDVATDRHRIGSRREDRTSGSSNYLFMDGHVETIPAMKMKALVEGNERKPWLPHEN